MPPRNHFAAAYADIALNRKIVAHMERFDALARAAAQETNATMKMLLIRDMKKMGATIDKMRAKLNWAPAEESDEEEEGEDPQ